MSAGGCDEAYSLDETTSGGVDCLVRCGGNAFPLEYLEGPAGPLDEGQLDAPLGSVNFTGYQPASSAATRNEEDIPALVGRTSERISKFVDIVGQEGSGRLADEEVD